MKRIPLVVALFSLSITLPIYAYQFEVEVGYTDSETDYDSNFWPDEDSDSVDVGGTYYFSDVETNKGPLSVVAFLNRTSNISAFYADGETKVDASQLIFSGPTVFGGLGGYGTPTLGSNFLIPVIKIFYPASNIYSALNSE